MSLQEYIDLGTMKAVYKQLKDNSKIEVCFFSPDVATTGKGDEGCLIG